MTQDILSGMPGHLIRRMHQTSTQIFQEVVKAQGHDVTSVQFAALMALHGNPGLDQARLAEVIGYDRATIGGVVQRLERKGLLVRTTDPEDRRARHLALTTEGEALRQMLEPLVAQVQERILAALSPHEQATFMTLSRKVLGTQADHTGE